MLRVPLRPRTFRRRSLALVPESSGAGASLGPEPQPTGPGPRRRRRAEAVGDELVHQETERRRRVRGRDHPALDLQDEPDSRRLALVEAQQPPRELAQVVAQVHPVHLAGEVQLVVQQAQRLDPPPDRAQRRLAGARGARRACTATRTTMTCRLFLTRCCSSRSSRPLSSARRRSSAAARRRETVEASMLA